MHLVCTLQIFLTFGREILQEIWREFCGIFSDPPKWRLSIFCEKIQGFSNVPWHKCAFWPGTKYVILEFFLGILSLCMGKGAPLVRYLCTTWESHHMFFTEVCPSSGTKYVSFELFWGILGGAWGGERGAPGTWRHVWEMLIFVRKFVP